MKTPVKFGYPLGDVERVPPREILTRGIVSRRISTGLFGVNINDATQNFTDLILSGKKTIETRSTDSLRPYVGRRVGIVRTGKGSATLVGFAVLGTPKIYTSRKQFRRDAGKHMVAPDSIFDFQTKVKK